MAKKFTIIRPNRFFALDVEDGGKHQQLPLYAYMTYQPAKGRYEDFLDAGVKLMSIAVYSGDRGINPHSAIRPFRPGFMEAPGVYNFKWLDEDLKLATCGRAIGEVYVLLRVMLEMPLWWEDAHPNARCLDASGTPLHCSYSSGEWLDACADAIRALHEHLEESGWSDYVAGYHLAAGSTEEFIKPRLYGYQYCDYSEVSKANFRRVMEEQYGLIDALNAAWNSNYTSFDQIEPPTPIERRYYGAGHFRDMKTERKLIDHAKFTSRELVDFAAELAKRTKAICDGNKLVGAFYGYVGINDPDIGHNAVTRCLECEDIDFFASPFFYTNNRAPDVDWPFAGPVEAAANHGKPWFTEADVRTYLSRPISEAMKFANPEANSLYDGPVWFGPDSERSSISQMLRAYTRILTHGSAIWWFDMWGGWYDTDAMREFHKFARRDYAEAVFPKDDKPRGNIRSQVAVFIDKNSACGLHPGFSGVLISRQIETLGTLGAPYDVYMIEDLATVDPKSYRMAILLSPEKNLSEQVLESWKCGGRTLVFVGVPGYFDNDGEPGKNCEIKARLVSGNMKYQAILNGKPYPSNEFTAPSVELECRENDLVLASSTDAKPLLVLHKGKGYQILWSLAPCIPTDFLREQLLLCGGKVYNFTNDNIYAADDVIAIHACSEGVKRVYFPYAGKALDAISGERLPGTELYAEMSMEKGETRMLRFVDPRVQ